MKRPCGRLMSCLMLMAGTLGPVTVAHSDLVDYLRLLCPRVLKQLDMDTVRLVNELPNLDHQNEMIAGQLFARAG